MKKARKKLFALILVVLTLTAGLEAFAAGGLTRSGALAAALKDAGLAEADVIFTKCAKDTDDGVMKYEIEFRTKDGMEYEYDFSADSGTILEKNAEMDD